MKYAFLFFSLFLGCSEPQEDQKKIASTKKAAPWFENVANEVGIDHTFYSGDVGNYYIIETMGGGAALFDFDNDGDLDLYITQGNVLEGRLRSSLQNKLYENVGGEFEERGVVDGTQYSIGVTTGDYNNDGFVDLYITNFGRNTLLKNKGDGSFEDVTEIAGVGESAFSACAEFSDLDLDGDLDLFVTNYLDWTPETEKECFSEQNRRDYCNPSSYVAPIPDTLYFNNGDGTFSNVSQQSGIASIAGTGLGLAIATIDGDHLPDIFVANDGMPDRLWINQGNGTFKESAMLLGCAVDDSGKEKASMGVELMDADQDGDLDLLVTTLFKETDSFYLNDGGIFVDATARWGLAADTRTYTRWGIAVEDFDNDGLDDLYEATGRVRWQADNWSESDWLAEPNLLFTQEKLGRFSLVDSEGGVSSPLVKSAHGVSSGDIDGDGGVDLIVVNKDATVDVLKNVVQNRGNWIVLDVRNKHSSPALGAVVKVTLTAGTVVTKHVRSGHGYASASDPRIHLGLGDEAEVASVSVQWPDGSTKIIESLEAGSIYIITP